MDMKNPVKNFASRKYGCYTRVSLRVRIVLEVDAERSECEEYPLGYSNNI